MFFCFSTCCARHTARPPPRAARGTGLLDAGVESLRISQRSCRRAPDTAHVVRPCLERLSCGNQRTNIVHVAKLKLVPCAASDAIALSARLRPPRLLGVHPAGAWSPPVAASWNSPEHFFVRSSAVLQSSLLWRLVASRHPRLNHAFSDRPACVSGGAMCSLHACECPAANTPAPRPRAPLTTLRREALCKVFLQVINLRAFMFET